MRFSILILGSALSFGASFHELAPKEIQEALKARRGEIIRVLSEDPDLVKDAGARSTAELNELSFAFEKAAAIYDFDYSDLDRAVSFEDLVKPTGNYTIPLCVKEKCGTMAIVGWQGEGSEPKIRYVGRALQQEAFQEAEIRAQGLEEEMAPRLINTDILNYVYIPQSYGPGYLISATRAQERDLARLMEKDLSEEISPLTLSDFKRLVQIRAQIYQDSSFDDFEEAVAQNLSSQWVPNPKHEPVSLPVEKSPSIPSQSPKDPSSFWRAILAVGTGLGLFWATRKRLRVYSS